jgi:hypothetical protein
MINFCAKEIFSITDFTIAEGHILVFNSFKYSRHVRCTKKVINQNAIGR